jgi:hypothetical protein
MIFASTDNPVFLGLACLLLPVMIVVRIMGGRRHGWRGVRWLFDWRREPGQPLLFNRGWWDRLVRRRPPRR